MESSTLFPQPSPEDKLDPSPEQQAEIERIQHGIAVLDLFSQEDAAEERRNKFLWLTRPGAETREQILAGATYRGDQNRLEEAIRRAKGGYAVRNIKRKAMHEHALYMGISAELTREGLAIPNPKDQALLGREHGKWRTYFARPSSQPARKKYKEFLEKKVSTLRGEEEPEAAETKVWPSVDIQERAVLLTRAINAMAHRSMLSGLGIGVADEQYNEAIYERYEEETLRVDENSAKKVDRLLAAAKRDFWHASGFPVLRQTGLMSEFLLERRAQKMWKEFAGQFEHSPQQEERVKMRKRLRVYIPDDRMPETSIKGI